MNELKNTSLIYSMLSRIFFDQLDRFSHFQNFNRQKICSVKVPFCWTLFGSDKRVYQVQCFKSPENC